MANVNKVILIGNLTRDPELRYTAGQRAVTDLSLAVNRFVGGGEGGDRKEETLFIDVTVWERQAETACQYLSKGRQVYVEGYLRMDTWDDKETGQKRSKIKAVAQNVQFLDSRREDGAAPRGEGPAAGGPASESSSRPAHDRAPAARPAPPPRAPVQNDSGADEDIPF